MTHNHSPNIKLYKASRFLCAFFLIFNSYIKLEAKNPLIDSLSFIETKRYNLEENEIHWIEDDGSVDCIRYSFYATSSNNSFTNTRGKKQVFSKDSRIKINIRLDFENQLHPSWREEGCSEFSLKVVFPKGFKMQGGNYKDFMPINLNDRNPSQEIFIEGIFTEENSDACFLLLKGPQVSNEETIFVKKRTLCLSSNSEGSFLSKDNLSSINQFQGEALNSSSLRTVANSTMEVFGISAYLDQSDCPNTNCSNKTICNGESTLLFSDGCLDGTILWSNGLTTENIIVSPSNTTVYTATCTVDGQVSTSNDLTITVSGAQAPNHLLTISGDNQVCAENTFVLTASGCPIDYTYKFKGRNSLTSFESEGSTLNQTTGKNGGSYFITANCEKDGECSSVESQAYTVSKINPITGRININFISAGIKSNEHTSLSDLSNVFCIGQTIEMSTSGCEGTISWGNGIIDNAFDVTFTDQIQTFDYTCEYQGCSLSGTISLPAGTNQIPSPSLSFEYAGNNNLKAVQKDPNEASVVLTASSCSLEYIWWDGLRSTDPIRSITLQTANETETFSVQCIGSDVNCISESASVTLYYLNPNQTTTDLCNNGSVSLELVGCTNGTVEWTNNIDQGLLGTGTTHSYINQGLSSNQIINFVGKCITPYANEISSGNIEIPINLEPINAYQSIAPPIVTSNQNYLCTDSPVVLSASGCTQGILWSNGQVGNNIEVSIAGTYSAKCTVDGLCESLESNELSIIEGIELLTPTLNVYERTVCQGSTVTNTFTASGCNSYLWSDGSTLNKITVSPTVTTSYDVRCTSASSCPSPSATATIFVEDIPAPTKPIISSSFGPVGSQMTNCDDIPFSLTASNCNGSVNWSYRPHNTTSVFYNVGSGPSTNIDHSIHAVYFATCVTGCQGSNNYLTNTDYVILYPPVGDVTATNNGPKNATESITLTALASNVEGSSTTKYTWTGPNSFSSTSSNKLAFISNVTSLNNGTYTVTVNNNKCSATATTVVTINDCNDYDIAPVISAQGNTSICENETIELQATGCAGIVTWNTNATGNTLTVSSAGSYTATCGDGQDCNSPISNSIEIMVNPTPSPPSIQSSNGGTEMCSDGSLTLIASNCLNGTVDWSNGSSGNSIIISETGVYTATCTSSEGCVSSLSNSLTITEKTIPQETPAITLTPTSDPCFDLLTATGCTADVYWTWTSSGSQEGNTSSTGTLQIAKTEIPYTYKAQCSNECGLGMGISNEIITEVTLPVIISKNESQEIIDYSDITICSQDNVTLSATNCSGTISWNSTDINNQTSVLNESEVTVSPNVTTTYTAICTSCNQNISSESITLQIQDPNPPTISASTYLVCSNSEDRTPTVFTATGCESGTINWSNGNTGSSFSLVLVETDIYTATCTIGSCVSPNSNAIQVTVLTPPLPPVLSALEIEGSTICSDRIEDVTLEAAACNGDILWSTGENTTQINVLPSSTTTYTATCTNDCGTASSDFTLTIEPIPLSPLLEAVNQSICQGESTILSAPNCTGELIWTDGSSVFTQSSRTVNPTQTSTYKAICKSILGGCVSEEASITILVSQPVNPIIAADQNLVCLGAEVTISTSDCSSEIEWFENDILLAENTSSITRSSSGNAIYKVSCFTEDCSLRLTSNTVTVNTIPLLTNPVISSTSSLVCAGTSVELNSSSCLGTLSWSNGASTSTINVSPIVTTTYTVSCTNDCETVSSSVTIIVEEQPVLPDLIALKNDICVGETIDLSVTNCNGTLTWSDISENQSDRIISPTQETTYSVYCTNPSGLCVSPTAQITIGVNQIVLPSIAVDTNDLCPGDLIPIIASGCDGDVLWNTGDITNTTNGNPSSITKPAANGDIYSISCATPNCSLISTASSLVIPTKPEAVVPFVSYTTTSICLGEELTLYAGYCNGSIVWNDGSTETVRSLSPTETTSYNVTCTSFCDTKTSESVEIIVNNFEAPVLSSSMSEICLGTTATLTATNCDADVKWTTANGFEEFGSEITVQPSISTTYTAICTDLICSSPSASIDILVKESNSKPVITTNTGITAVCKETEIILTASGCETGTLTWSNGEVGRSIISNENKRAIGQEFPYYVTCTSDCETLVSEVINILVIKPTQPVLSPAFQEVCVGSTFELNVTTACTNGYLQWNKENDELNQTELNPSLLAEAKGTTRYRVKCVIGACKSPNSETAAEVKVNEIAEAIIRHNSPVTVGDKISIQGNGSKTKEYSWTGPNNYTSEEKNFTIEPASTDNAGIYTLTTSNGGSCTATASVDITVIDEDCGCDATDKALTINPINNPSKAFGNYNYVVENTYLQPFSEIPSTDVEAVQTVSYFDGLGRPIQSMNVNAAGGPYRNQLQQDVVSFMKYDAFGRETQKFLPFGLSNNGGDFIEPTAMLAMQQNYYSSQPGKATDGNKAFAEVVFENSPLNRALEQSAPGEDFSLENGHTTKMTYSSNTTLGLPLPNGNKEAIKAYLLDNVKLFYFNDQTGDITSQTVETRYYDAHELMATLTEDANGHLSASFTDKSGNVVAKRVYNEITLDGAFSADEIIETNYIYNDFGQLQYVLQPMASKELDNLSIGTSLNLYTTPFTHFIFFYEYDARGRMTKKRVPGMDAFVNMSYDLRDRLTKTTDANGKTTRMEYDGLNRPTRTYLRNGDSDDEKLISENFYDNYTNANGKTFDVSHAFGVTNLTNTTGMPTVSRIAVMDEDNNIRQLNGSDQYLHSVSYYDNLGRAIQTQTDNVQGLAEVSSTKLDFAGRAIESHSTVNYEGTEGVQALNFYTKTTYEQGGRVASLSQKINEDRWEPIARNTYTPLGELVTKTLGCDIQNVDYEYNIRGWLTKINDVEKTGEAYKNSKDLFSMSLSYTGDYTGNITSQSWRTMDKVHKNINQVSIAEKQNYAYSYDHLNRLLTADYNSSDATLALNGISTSMFAAGSANKAYDLNGNILNMLRNVNGSTVDQMSYTYQKNNRLDAVTDAATDVDTRYFNELNTTTDDYTYDAMGNMVADKNKGVTEIKYNHANLPIQIVRDNTNKPENNGRMKYYYSAAGQKLMTEVATTVTDGASIDAERTRTYLGGMVLKAGEIEFIGTPEGRVLTLDALHKNVDGSVQLPNYIDEESNMFRYEYQLKDHLGNLRVACRCGDPLRKDNGDVRKGASNREPIRIVQQNDYDAWGLDFGSSTANSSEDENLKHRYLYNGKEKVTDLGIELYEYGFRWHDPQIGRFIQVDPLANDYPYKSTYDYAENYPVGAIDLDGLEKLITTTYNVQQIVQKDGNYSFKLNQLGPKGISGGGNWSGIKTNNVFYHNNEQVASLNDIPGYKEYRANEQAKLNRKIGEVTEKTGTVVKYVGMVSAVVQPEIGVPIAEVGAAVETGGVVMQAAADIAEEKYDEAGKRILAEAISILSGKVLDKQISKFIGDGDGKGTQAVKLTKEIAEDAIPSQHDN